MRIVSGSQLALKKRKKICIVSQCSCSQYISISKKTGKKTTSLFCPRHRRQREKERNPIVYYFGALKQAARQRGKEFKLTLQQFRDFCSRTNYIELKGREANSLSIDRINPLLGYEVGNIQVLTKSENTRKMHADKKWMKKYTGKLKAATIDVSEFQKQPMIEEESPF